MSPTRTSGPTPEFLHRTFATKQSLTPESSRSRTIRGCACALLPSPNRLRRLTRTRPAQSRSRACRPSRLPCWRNPHRQSYPVYPNLTSISPASQKAPKRSRRLKRTHPNLSVACRSCCVLVRCRAQAMPVIKRPQRLPTVRMRKRKSLHLLSRRTTHDISLLLHRLLEVQSPVQVLGWFLRICATRFQLFFRTWKWIDIKRLHGQQFWYCISGIKFYVLVQVLRLQNMNVNLWNAILLQVLRLHLRPTTRELWSARSARCLLYMIQETRTVTWSPDRSTCPSWPLLLATWWRRLLQLTGPALTYPAAKLKIFEWTAPQHWCFLAKDPMHSRDILLSFSPFFIVLFCEMFARYRVTKEIKSHCDAVVSSCNDMI